MSITVEVGQPVIMVEGNHSRHMTTRRGTVTKAARVWITVQPDDDAREYAARRYRLDSQTDGSPYSYAPRFYTLEQWAERERRIEAEQFLSEQGVRIERASPWSGHVIELAELIRPHTKS